MNVLPIVITGNPPPPTKPYPIKPEALTPIRETIKELKDKGIIVEMQSRCNSPIWPVKKSDQTWRLTVDYRNINSHADRLTPIVADPNTILSEVPSEHTVFSALNISNGFFSIPVHPDSQFWFAFTFEGWHFTFTRLSQGYHNSPTLLHRALSDVLSKLPKIESNVVQYVDDLLISSPDKETHIQDLEVILEHLANNGVKCNPQKAQIARDEVIYLGFVISLGRKRLTIDRMKGIQECPRPKNVRAVRKILGLFNFCRHYIPNYSTIVQPINELMKGAGGPHDTVTWSPECEQAFITLKQLCTAPGLGLPNPLLPYTLYTM